MFVCLHLASVSVHVLLLRGVQEAQLALQNSQKEVGRLKGELQAKAAELTEMSKQLQLVNVELNEAKRMVTAREGGIHDRLKKANEEIVALKQEVRATRAHRFRCGAGCTPNIALSWRSVPCCYC